MANKTNLIIRQADPSDFEAVDRLFGRSYPVLLQGHYSPATYISALPVISRAQPELLASGLFFVVEDANKDVVAAGGWSMEPPKGGQGMRGVGHVRHVATDHRRLRQGIGRALITHIKLHAKGSGMMKLQCFSTLNAQAFYSANGFTSLGEGEVQLSGGIGFPVVVMECLL